MTQQTTDPAQKVNELRAQLEAAEAEQRAAYAAALGDLHNLQDAWRKDLVSRGAAINSTLEAAEQGHFEAAKKAGRTGDLQTAYIEYVNYHAARRARGFIRTQEQSAAATLGEEPRIASDLSFVRPTFTEFLEAAVSDSIGESAQRMMTDYLSPMPDELPEDE